MIAFFLTVFLDVLTGSSFKMLEAVSSFEKPARNSAAKQTRYVAVALLLFGACCGVTAGILFDVNDPKLIDDVFGWTALACVLACVVCGFRYQYVNTVPSEFSDGIFGS